MLGRIVNVDGAVGLVIAADDDGYAVVRVFGARAANVGDHEVIRDPKSLRTWAGEPIVGKPAGKAAKASEAI